MSPEAEADGKTGIHADAVKKIQRKIKGQLSITPLLAGLLAACGDDTEYIPVYSAGTAPGGGTTPGDGTTPGGGTGTFDALPFDVYVADGIVEGARVYIDTNDSGTIDTADVLIGETDAQGRINVEGQYAGQTILVDVAGAKDLFTGATLPDGIVYKAVSNERGASDVVVSPISTIMLELQARDPDLTQAEIFDLLFGAGTGIEASDLNDPDSYIFPVTIAGLPSGHPLAVAEHLATANLELQAYLEQTGGDASAVVDLLLDDNGFDPASDLTSAELDALNARIAESQDRLGIAVHTVADLLHDSLAGFGFYTQLGDHTPAAASNDAAVQDTLVYHDKGTATTSDDVLVLVIEDFTAPDTILLKLEWSNVRIEGGADNDTLAYPKNDRGTKLFDGGAGNDTLTGGLGTDAFFGGAGDDTMLGDDDADIFFGDAGADKMDGGSGIDIVSYAASSAGVTVDLSATPDADGYVTASGGDAAGDKLKNIEHVIGSAHNDTLDGGAGNDTIDGGAGDDTLYGGAGNDTIDGGDGDDIIDGGAGNDVIVSGGGQQRRQQRHPGYH
ncbi:MAG: calcium-binding protein [Parvibaculales bacterium]